MGLNARPWRCTLAKKMLSDVACVAEALEPYNLKTFTVTNWLVNDEYGGYKTCWELEVQVLRTTTINIRFTGTRGRFLVCVRRVFARMAQGGTPYGSH